MNSRIILAALVLAASVSALQTIKDDLRVSPSTITRKGGNAKVDSSLTVGKRPTSTNLHTVAGWEDGNDTVKQSTTAPYADTAAVSRKSLLTTHGVTSGTVPKAATDSTFTNSHISENGDTTKVTHAGAVADTFTYSGVSAVSSIYAGCSAPNGDCYYAVGYTAPGFYIQSGGSGALTRVTSFASGVLITAMTSDPSGNIYGFRYWDGGGYVYKRTAGTGNFDTVATGRKEWVGGTCDKNGVLYGVTHHDSIYTSSDQGVTWTFLQQIYDASSISFSNAAPDGTLYMAVYRSVSEKTIYRKTPSQTQFYDMNIPGWWGSIGIDTSGNIFFSTSTADGTYMSSDGLSSYRKIQNRTFPYTLFGKVDGTMCGISAAQIWTKTADPLRTVFAVYGGNTKLAGKLTVDNTPLSTSPAFLLVKNVEPDNEVKKIPVSVLDPPAHNVTPGQIPMSNGATTFRNTGTTVDSTTGDIHVYGKVIVGDTLYTSVPGMVEGHGNQSDVDKDSLMVSLAAAPAGDKRRGGTFRAFGNDRGLAGGNTVMESGDSGDAYIGGQEIYVHVDHPSDTSAIGVPLFKTDVRIGRDDALPNDTNRVAVYLGRDADSSSGRIFGGKGLSTTKSAIALGNSVSNKITISADTVRIVDRLETILTTATTGEIDTLYSKKIKSNRIFQDSIWHAYGGFHDSSVTISISTANDWQQVTNAAHTLWGGEEADGISLSGDTMVFAHGGDYHGTAKICYSALSAKDFSIRFYNVTQSDSIDQGNIPSTTGVGNVQCVTQPIYLEITAGDRMIMQITCNTDGTDPVIKSGRFELSYLHD